MSARNFFLLVSIFVLGCLNVQATKFSNCAVVVVNNTALFNLCDFANDKPFNVTYNTGGIDSLVSFTLGTAHNPSCSNPQQTNTWGTVTDMNTLPDTCYEIAVDSPNITLQDSTNDHSGLLITFPYNNNSNYPRQLVVNLLCATNMSSDDPTVFTPANTFFDDQTITLTAYSSYGCPYATLSQLFGFLSQYKYPFIGIAIILGLFVSFFGLKMFNPSIFIITTILGTFFSGMFFFEFVKFGSQEWILWVIFGACVIIGLVLGYLAITYEKLGFFALGAALGVVLGLLFYSAVLSQFTAGTSVLYYLVIVICALIGGGLAIWLWKNVVIISTSFIGSYMIVRALSVIIGGFPNEQAVAEGAEPLDAVAYLYFLAIAALAIIAMYVQFREKRRQEDEDEDEDTLPKNYMRV